MGKWMWAMCVVATFGLAACESNATCDEVGSHVIDVMTRSLGIPRTSEWEQNAKTEADTCRQKAYSTGARNCIMKASSARSIDRCLGQ